MPKKKSVKKAPGKRVVTQDAPVVVQVTETAVEPGKTKTVFTLKKKVWTYVGVLVLVGALAVPGVYYYRQYDKAQTQLKGAKVTGDSAIVEAVSKLYELPAGESPTVATVSDIAALKKSEGYTPFFANAANGDKVLVYQTSGKAILYRPGSNKIIEVAPLNAPAAQAQPQEAVAGESTKSATLSPSPIITSEPAAVVILNGTKKAGLAKQASSKLTSLESVKVVSTGNAKADHKTTVVFDASGKKGAVAALVAAEIGGSVVKTLPEGESQPTSGDIIVFLGADYTE